MKALFNAKAERSDELSADEVARASTMAMELLHQDVERQSVASAAEEIGIPPEYLARAAGILLEEKRRRQERTARRRLAALVGACVAVVISAVNTVEWQLHRPLPLESHPAVHLPPPMAEAKREELIGESNVIPDLPKLGIIPIDPGAPITVRGQQAGSFPTSITFKNDYAGAIHVSEIGPEGSIKPVAELDPGETLVQNTSFGDPFLITDGNNLNVGLYFASGTPTYADVIHDNVINSFRSDPLNRKSFFPGFLLPVQRTHMSPHSSAIPTAIQFVNLRGAPVQVLKLGHDGSRIQATLQDGTNGTWDTSTADTWMVTDLGGKLIAKYVAEPAPKTAVIWPGQE